MIYPYNFEAKIGITKIRELACHYCLYEPGKEEIRGLDFSDEFDKVRLRLEQVEEFRSILLRDIEFPIEHFIDISPSLRKAKVQGSFLEEQEVFNLKRALDSVRAIINFLKKDEEDHYPRLKEMSAEVKLFPVVNDRINKILNRHGKIKDSASANLQDIRRELAGKEAAISKKLNQILQKARQQGFVDEDTSLAIRNGRPVIPVTASYKRQIPGYVHDESSTGKTAYIEPVEVVEANNELRELENAERREIIKILTEFTDFIRPYLNELAGSHKFLASIDSVRARARFALDINAVLPRLVNKQEIDWHQAIHPLLLLSFREAGRAKEVVPLDVQLNEEYRILLISGPNAGGKSVSLQTTGILQYLLQCGFLVPMAESSVCGIFNSFFLDMGDEQSIEDDLSTYSSHLQNMKNFVRNADSKSLVLIDEFGSGTEPTLGGAIAESVLEDLNNKGVYGVITTHYANLKHFASSAEGILNGAMLFDTGKLQPLYRLSSGRPGSSFAFEIARKIGLPEEILRNARERVGQEHVDFEKHLKDLIRDKKYWENKRQRIRVAEKRLSELVSRYDSELKDTEKLRKKIVREAKEQAEQLLNDANRRIENTIREIRESEAEKAKTRAARKKLEDFRQEVNKEDDKVNSDGNSAENLKEKLKEVSRHNEKIRQRDPSYRRKQNKKPEDPVIRKGDYVIMKGQDIPGEVLSLKGKKANVAFGAIRTIVDQDSLEKISKERYQSSQTPVSGSGNAERWNIGKKRLSFSPDIDVRGKRADEALRIITDFIDDAVMLQNRDLRILHGKGNGILREIIRQYLEGLDVVDSFKDEHVERGGAGITVVKLDI